MAKFVTAAEAVKQIKDGAILAERLCYYGT